MGRPTNKQAAMMDEKAEEMIPKLAAIGCTYEEIGDITGIDRSTVIRKYSHLYQTGRSNLKVSLRRTALQRAQQGSDSILKKLLEQYLPDMKEQEVAVQNVFVDYDSKDKVKEMIARKKKELEEANDR